MKKKYLLLLIVIMLISGCENQNDNNSNNNRSNYTAKKMQDNKFNYFIETNDDINEETMDAVEEEHLISNTLIDDSNINNQETIIDNQPISDDANATSEDNLQNNNNIYTTVNSDIDCLDTDECLEKSLPIQHGYQEIIANVFYHEVLSNTNDILGYNIEYILKDNIFNSFDECIEITDSLKEKIGLKIGNYICNEDGSMVVIEN